MENIHSEMYAKLIENLIHDTKEKLALFSAIEINLKSENENKADFGTKTVDFGCY